MPSWQPRRWGNRRPAYSVSATCSAATLAGIRKLTAAGTIAADADVVAVLTGNVLKDPDYIYRYHTGDLKAPDGTSIEPNFGNRPIIVSNDADKIANLLAN